MAILKIKNLFLRTYIGFSEHEVGKLQDLIINIKINYNSDKPEISDRPEDALNYKILTKQIVDLVEHGSFNLIESLARKIIILIMEDLRVKQATVEIDKPHALRFTESVSFELTEQRNDE